MGEDIDAYMATFKRLVHKAGYNLRNEMVLEIFRNGIPVGLYDRIFNINKPDSYEGWQQAVLRREEKFLHLKAWREATDKMYRTKKSSTKPSWTPKEVRDPNTMDTTPRRTRA